MTYLLKRAREESLVTGIPPNRTTPYKCGNKDCSNKYKTDATSAIHAARVQSQERWNGCKNKGCNVWYCHINICKLKLVSEHANMCKHKPKIQRAQPQHVQFGTIVETHVNSNVNVNLTTAGSGVNPLPLLVEESDNDNDHGIEDC